MFLIPYDRFHFQTTLAPSKLVDRLQVEAGSTYSGPITETGFSFVRSIFGRNSYLPRVRGRFVPVPDGTRITVTTSLQPLVVATFPTAFLIVVYVSVRNGNGALIPLSLFLLSHSLLYLFGYLPERKRAVSLVQRVLGSGGGTLGR